MPLIKKQANMEELTKLRLIKTLSVQTYSHRQFRMFAFIIRAVNELGLSYHVKDGNIYVQKGHADIYPCIVAHMDTVHKITSDLTVIELDNKLTGFNKNTMTQTGIGGDDKVGVFIAIECLRNFDDIKAVFFRDEEVGCEGSCLADVDWFSNCSLILQCDRKGNSDFVTKAGVVTLSSKKFNKSVTHIADMYRYKFSTGLMTDVMTLKEMGIGVSAANISCGYYNPHTDREFVNINDVHKCMNMVYTIIAVMGRTVFPHKYERSKPGKYKSTGKYHSWGDRSDGDTGYFGSERSAYDRPVTPKRFLSNYSEYGTCDCCGYARSKTQFFNSYNMDICEDCVRDYMIS